MASSSRTESEARFERYLSENGYAFEHEPEWGVDTRPDYLIARAGVEAVCEVKEFATTAIRDALAGSRVGFLSDKQVFGSVRNQLDTAARQLKPLASRGLPLVVVLANPRRADVSLEPDDVMAAMYGNPAFSIPIGPEGATGAGEYFLNRDGSVTAKHAYLSAVVTLHEWSLEQDWADREVKRFKDHPFEFVPWARGEREAGRVPEGTRRFAHVFHTTSAADGRATPLPDDLFDGPQDAMWKVVDGAYVQLRGGSD